MIDTKKLHEKIKELEADNERLKEAVYEINHELLACIKENAELEAENKKLSLALEDLVFHSIEMAAISKARGAEILEIPLIDLFYILDKKGDGE